MQMFDRNHNHMMAFDADEDANLGFEMQIVSVVEANKFCMMMMSESRFCSRLHMHACVFVEALRFGICMLCNRWQVHTTTTELRVVVYHFAGRSDPSQFD